MTKLDARSMELRRRILRAVRGGRRGHIGSSFSVVEILRVLYDDILRIPTPDDPSRDRFILSKGHGCLAQYVFLAEKGFIPDAELDRYCAADGMLGGHPEHRVAGVEFSTGSLGHGLPVAIGIALAAKHDRRDFRTYVVMGDGECNEGSIWECALYAQKHKLTNLVAAVDYNKMMTYGTTGEVLDLEPFADKWRSFGFAVREVDGHDLLALREAFRAAPFERDRPSMVICHTIKGKGIRAVENVASWHHKAKVSDEDLKLLETGLATYEDIL